MDKEVQQTTDFYRLVAWVHANRKQVLWGGLMAAIAGAVVGGYFWHAGYHEDQGEEAVSSLKRPAGDVATAADAEPFIKVANEYGDTKGGALALLTAGGILFEAGKFDQAEAQFEKLLQQHPEYPLAGEAALGVAASLEAQGKTGSAITHYEDFLRRHLAEPTIPQAKVALARLYESQNKPDQALRLYEELGMSGSSDSWTAEARIERQQLLLKHPELVKQAPPPQSATMMPNTLTIPTTTNGPSTNLNLLRP